MNAVDPVADKLGVELEYMIVDRTTLDVRPVADRLIHGFSRRPKNEVKHGSLRLSNELVMHVLELKTDGPVSSLDGLAGRFQQEIRDLNARLAADGCRLLGSAMHPWMEPETETRLWPHGDRRIYETFDRIFNCRGHGWSNLQSTHLNLGFRDEAHFVKLHDAIRLLLPLIPALAASSPFRAGRASGSLDTRLEAYRMNCSRFPSISGAIVPEPVRSQAEYHARILEPIYRDLAPHDPEGVLAHEWTNARGAIARFERGAIEIRVMDVQEHPAADLGLLAFFLRLLRAMIEQEAAVVVDSAPQGEERLAALYTRAVQSGMDAPLDFPEYHEAWLGDPGGDASLGTLLEALWERIGTDLPAEAGWIIRHGSLAQRLLRACGSTPDRGRLFAVYAHLAECLEQGCFFDSDEL